MQSQIVNMSSSITHSTWTNQTRRRSKISFPLHDF